MEKVKYIIDKIDGYIYKLNGNVIIDEVERIRFSMKEDKREQYKEITEEEYMEIKDLKFENSYSVSHFKLLAQTIEKAMR